MVGLDPGRHPPGRGGAFRALLRRRRRQHHHPVEFRHARFENEQAFEIDRQWSLRRIDGQVNAGIAAVGALAGGDAKRVARPVDGEAAIAAHRTRERTNVAGESDVVQLQRATACRIMQRDAAGEVEAVDGERSKIGAAVGDRPVDPALQVETEVERQALDGELVGAPFAAHQFAERELDVELVGANLAEIVGAADHDRAQPQRRRWQQPRIQRARHPHRGADHPGRLGLELRPKLVPIDEKRPDQRGYQRKYEGNRQSEQGRLHGVSSWTTPGADGPAASPPEHAIYRDKYGEVTAS